MTILVATRNEDKFTIVRRMVECVVSDAHLLSLAEANVAGDVVEAGTISQRAVQKAKYYVKRLKLTERSDDFDAVLAIDDGLSIAGGAALPHSKELTDRILNGEWPIGESITVVRAFALVRKGEQPRVEETTVPFRFLGNSQQIKREKGKYPLSLVLAPDGKSSPVASLTTEEEDKFNLQYSRESLERLFG